MIDTKLKPCPFCGGKARKVFKVNNVYGHAHYEIAGIYPLSKPGYVECSKCRTRTKECSRIRNAIMFWNTRKPMERIVWQLEELRPDIECFDDEDDFIYSEERHEKYLEIVQKEGAKE